MADYLGRLNPMQLAAATHMDGPLLILAGAGSGKTATMTARIAHMIREKGVDPYSMLAVTFTNKAAGEMRERVEALTGRIPGMWISTFHSACVRILRDHCERLGYRKGFTIYDTLDQRAVIKNILKSKEISEKEMAPAYILSVISARKELGEDAATFASEGIGRGSYANFNTVAMLYAEYENALKRNNAMDFDDLIMLTVRLFETFPEILEQYRRKFRYIMVDEYQDTNMLQYRLLHLLAADRRNICVVGDDDQCIYEWRGADIRNILEFEKDFPGAKVIKLEQNYRSTGNILDAANSVIANNRGRKEKKLWTSAEAGEKIDYYRAETDQEEASYVGAKIARLKRNDDSLKYSDFAILYRMNAQSRRFEEYFGKVGIPYRILSGLRFYDRKEVKDAIAYMRLIQNPRDDVSLLRIINEPRRGVGPKTLEIISDTASGKGVSLFEVLTDEDVCESIGRKSVSALQEFSDVVEDIADRLPELTVGEVYDEIILRSGYLTDLENRNDPEADGRLENLLEFRTVIAEREKEKIALGEGRLTLEDFLENISLISDIDNHDPEDDAVVLMTLHSAKGLEFPVVFMPGMENGIFPGYRTLDSGKTEDMEEERRLCYVGMTRAKNLLFLSSAERRMLYGRAEYSMESEFLSEIDRKYMQGDAVYGKKKSERAYVRYDQRVPYSAGPYVSPIRALRDVKRTAGTYGTEEGYNSGDKVRHRKFGEGTVISVEGNIVTVVFDEVGTKKLAQNVAPMEKVES